MSAEQRKAPKDTTRRDWKGPVWGELRPEPGGFLALKRSILLLLVALWAVLSALFVFGVRPGRIDLMAARVGSLVVLGLLSLFAGLVRFSDRFRGRVLDPARRDSWDRFRWLFYFLLFTFLFLGHGFMEYVAQIAG